MGNSDTERTASLALLTDEIGRRYQRRRVKPKVVSYQPTTGPHRYQALLKLGKKNQAR